MTFDRLVEVARGAEDSPRSVIAWNDFQREVRPDVVLALCEVVKAARDLAKWRHDTQEVDAALQRLDSLLQRSESAEGITGEGE